MADESDDRSEAWDFKRPRLWHGYRFLRSLGWSRRRALRWLL